MRPCQQFLSICSGPIAISPGAGGITPSILPNPGSYPLVVDALVAGPKFSCKLSRVLIDGGSTINILYRDTMVQLGLSERDLERSRTAFHGIVPGLSCTPLGRIRRDVIFGTEENCKRE